MGIPGMCSIRSGVSSTATGIALLYVCATMVIHASYNIPCRHSGHAGCGRSRYLPTDADCSCKDT